ncbi:MAG: RNA-binding domain-containing protein [Bacteroidota bacterium]
MSSAAWSVLNLLKENVVFSELSPEELDQIIGITERKSYQRNQQVFAQNQEAHYMFIVEEGEFVLSLHNSELKTFKRGHLFGEIGIINKDLRTAGVRAKSAAAAYAISGEKLFNTEIIPATTSLKVIRALAVKITNYLRSREQTPTSALIREGETEHVEFKSSLRWNTHINKKDQAIEHAALKTIAAFLNAEGGTLLIGVNDEGEILGLKADQFQNEDKMLLHLTKLIKDRIGTIFTSFINAEIEPIGGKQVLRIDCEPATLPAYLKDKNNEIFYVRTGPATTAMRVSKIFDYIKLRFEHRP